MPDPEILARIAPGAARITGMPSHRGGEAFTAHDYAHCIGLMKSDAARCLARVKYGCQDRYFSALHYAVLIDLRFMAKRNGWLVRKKGILEGVAFILATEAIREQPLPQRTRADNMGIALSSYQTTWHVRVEKNGGQYMAELEDQVRSGVNRGLRRERV